MFAGLVRHRLKRACEFYVCVCVCVKFNPLTSLDDGQRHVPQIYTVFISQEMATSDPCANAPPTPPEEPEPSPSPRKRRGRRKLEQTEKNKGTDSMQTLIRWLHT